MTARKVRLVPLITCAGLLAGCVGANPLSVGISLASMAAANSAGMANAAVISPQEQAKYAGYSCGELKQLIANYETGASVVPGAGIKNNAAAKKAMAMEVIGTRLAYLKKLSASRQC
jgi:hypothetical protein